MTFDKLTVAQVHWVDEIVPFSKQFDDFYFSPEGTLEEIEHTFIQPNNLSEKFANLDPNSFFRIAETGFGSGMNFLAIVHLWQQKLSLNSQLHYISFEKFPMLLADLQRVQQGFPQFSKITSALSESYPLFMPGWHDIWLFGGQVRLTLWFGDILKGLPELDASEGSKVDVWLLDGFTPSKNPDMWQQSLYQQMSRLSHKGSSFSTFTSAGHVRRGLQTVGFLVNKRKGYGKKREMCFGELVQVRPYHLKAPWFSRPPAIKIGSAIVIGAGLAGASVAYQLAKAGWQVEVIEEKFEVASAASGNLAAILHPLITADWNLRSQWYLQGFEATLRALQPWLKHKEIQGCLKGMVQLLVTQTSLERVEASLKYVGLPQNLAVWLTAEAASDKVGATVNIPGLFFPEGGWLSPYSVVKRCLQHELIEVHTQQSVQSITSKDLKSNNSWQVKTLSQTFRADVVVVATGSLNFDLNKQLGLPIRPVKGQVTHLKPSQQAFKLKYPLTHSGYSSPCGHGIAVTGATFEAPDLGDILSTQGHQANLKATNIVLSDWLLVDEMSAEELTGWVAFRPTTPDHLPIVGAIANKDWLESAYLSQSHTHAVYHYPQQKYQTGLYVSNGHGTRGLMSVFLAAESILADLQGSALVQPLSLYHASHPVRFVIRQWRSGKQVISKLKSLK